MNITQIQSVVKYITNAQGEKTEVIIPIELWNSLLQTIDPSEIYPAHQSKEDDPLALLRDSDFVGCFSGSPDLSDLL